MIFSGMPGISGVGSFVLSRGYSAPVVVSTSGGDYDITFTNLNQYNCILRPQNPIALITSINKESAKIINLTNKISEKTQNE